MEKLKNTSIYIKTFVLLFALLWGGSVMGQTYSYTHSGVALTGVVTYIAIPSETVLCGGDFTIEYTLTSDGSPELQYEDEDSNWQPVGTTNPATVSITSTELNLQVYVTDLQNGETVTLTISSIAEDQSLGILTSSQNITCHGGNDGEITVEAYCGNSSSYTYAWEYTSGDYSAFFTDPGNNSSSSGLYAGTYTITVTDGDNTTASIPVTLTEPDPLSISVNGDSYFCNQGNVEFTVTPSGGNAPYTVSVTDQTDQIVSGPFTYSDLPDDTYIISVVDDEGCAPPPSEEFIVDIDNAIPQFATFPDDQQMLYSDYNTEGNADLQVDVSAFEDNSTINSLTDGNSFDYVVDLSNYENPRMDFVFSVTGTPATGDYVRILYSYNGVDFTQILEYDQLTTSPLEDVALPLNELPSDNSTVTIRIEADFQTSGLSYDFTSFQIIADEVFSTDFTISPDETPTCSDDASECDGSPTFVDDPPVWLCNSGTNKEFYFERTWTILDNCGKSNTRTQIVGVGTPPTITAADDMIVDFCNNENIQVPVPTYNDDCGVASVSWEVTDNASGASPSSGSINEIDTHIGLTLNHPLAGESDIVYTITWTVTDDAGFTASVNQNVTILKPITVTLTLTPDNTNFCSGEEVSFEFTIDGGTRSYETILESDITPSGILFGSGNSYTYTTSSLELGALETENITIEITDSDVSNYEGGIYSVQGGCNETITFENGVDNGDGIPFTIHQNISTNPLERVD